MSVYLVEFEETGWEAVQCWKLQVNREYLIGRNSKEVDIRLPHVSISRQHAILSLVSTASQQTQRDKTGLQKQQEAAASAEAFRRNRDETDERNKRRRRSRGRPLRRSSSGRSDSLSSKQDSETSVVRGGSLDNSSAGKRSSCSRSVSASCERKHEREHRLSEDACASDVHQQQKMAAAAVVSPDADASAYPGRSSVVRSFPDGGAASSPGNASGSGKDQGLCLRWHLTELNAVNGTYMNEKRLRGKYIGEVGDDVCIAFAECSKRYRILREPPSSSLPCTEASSRYLSQAVADPSTNPRHFGEKTAAGAEEVQSASGSLLSPAAVLNDTQSRPRINSMNACEEKRESSTSSKGSSSSGGKKSEGPIASASHSSSRHPRRSRSRSEGRHAGSHEKCGSSSTNNSNSNARRSSSISSISKYTESRAEKSEFLRRKSRWSGRQEEDYERKKRRKRREEKDRSTSPGARQSVSAQKTNASSSFSSSATSEAATSDSKSTKKKGGWDDVDPDVEEQTRRAELDARMASIIASAHAAKLQRDAAKKAFNTALLSVQNPLLTFGTHTSVIGAAAAAAAAVAGANALGRPLLLGNQQLPHNLLGTSTAASSHPAAAAPGGSGLSVAEKRKLLWGGKRAAAAGERVDGSTDVGKHEQQLQQQQKGVLPGDGHEKGEAPEGQVRVDPNFYSLSFNEDEEKKNKFLKLMGYKGDTAATAAASVRVPPAGKDIKLKETLDSTLKQKMDVELEFQYYQGMKRKDGRKTGLGL